MQHAEAVDPLVVRLAGAVVRLRDDLGSRLAEEVDAANVIDVRLRQEDVADRPAIHGVISQTARALTDLMDSQRGLRLELMIVLLIVFEIGITLSEIFFGLGKH